MTDSIAQLIISNTPPVALSNELISAAVGVISNEMDEIHTNDNSVGDGSFDSDDYPKGNKGFLHRVNKITTLNIMDYLVGLGGFDVKRGMVSDFWSNHHTEILEYCQKSDPYAGQKSATRAVVRLMRTIDNGEVHYSDDRIKAALYSDAQEGADLTTLIIRKFAMCYVLLAVVNGYKASNK